MRAVVERESPADAAAVAQVLARPALMLRVAIVLGAFLGMVDATVVAVALAPLSAHFAVNAAAAQETLGVYLITVTVTLPTLGRLGDRLGRSRAYIAGFGVFILGSVLAALSPGFVALLGARAVQAVGGGMLTAGSLALVAEHAPRRRTGRSVALLVVTQAVAGLLGPPLGGLLVAVWGWQAVFWAGVPLAVLGIVLTARYIPPTVLREAEPLDIPGALLLALLLLGFTAGVASLGGPLPGGVPPAAWFAVAVAGLLGLALVEPRAARPVLDPGLLGDARFRAASIATFLSTGTLMSCFALLPFWLEEAHGASPIAAGFAFIPIGVGLAATSRWGGSLGDRGRTRGATMVGMGVAALGLAAAGLAALTWSWPLLLVGLLVLGCGNGLFSSPNTAAAIAVAPRTILGSAAGFLSTARNAGVVTGLGAAGGAYSAIVGHRGRPAGDDAAALVFGVAAVICVVVAGVASVTYGGDGPAGRR